MGAVSLRKFVITITPVIKGVGKINTGLKKIRKGLSQLTSQGNAVTRSLRNLAIGFVSFQAAARGGSFIAKTISEFEGLQTQLQTVLQVSKEVAGVEFEKLQDFSKKTPFLLQNVTKSFIQLRARGIKVTTKELKSIGNVAAAFGEDITGFANAVGQAVAGEGEPLKRFGIGLSAQGKKVEFTVDGVKTKVGRNSEEISKFLIGLGDTRFAGGIDRQVNTLGGAFSTLKDNIGIFVFEMGKAGLLDALREVVNELKALVGGGKDFAKMLGKKAGKAVLDALKAFKKLAKNMEDVRKLFKQLAERADLFKKAIQAALAVSAVVAIVKVLGFLVSAFQLVGGAAVAMFGGAGVGAGVVAAKFLALIVAIIAALAILFLVIDDLIVFFRGGDSLIGRFLKNIEKETGGTLERMSNLVKTAQETWKAFEPIFDALVMFLSTVLPGVFGVLGVIFKTPFVLLENVLNIVMLAFTQFLVFIQLIIAIFQQDWKTAGEKVGEIMLNLVKTLRVIFNNLFGLLGDGVKAFADLFKANVEGVMDLSATVQGPDPGSGMAFSPQEAGLTAGLAGGGSTAGKAAGAKTTNITNNVKVEANGIQDPAKVADMAAKRAGEETARAANQAAAQTAAGER